MKKKKKYFGVLSVVAVVSAVLMAAIFLFQLNNYEKAFLDLYGMEQDGYVKVTLDQIGRLGEDATEEKITDIISSLDSDSSKYWTLSTGDNILFIKSVTETNRYKNLSSDSYYDSETSREFIDSLNDKKVIHRIIYLKKDRYVASGGTFSWRGYEYRVCLLTYDKVILEQNVLLASKYAMLVMTIVVLVIYMICLMVCGKKIDEKNMQLEEYRQKMELSTNRVNKLDYLLRTQQLYSSRNHVFSGEILDNFLDELPSTEIECITLLDYHAMNQRAVERFWRKTLVIMDETVLRFALSDTRLLLICVGADLGEGKKYEGMIETKDVIPVSQRELRLENGSYYSQYHGIDREETQ